MTLNPFGLIVLESNFQMETSRAQDSLEKVGHVARPAEWAGGEDGWMLRLPLFSESRELASLWHA